MRGLHSNITELLLHSIIGINVSFALNKFTVPVYSPLIAKYDHVNLHYIGLGAYIRDDFPSD